MTCLLPLSSFISRAPFPPPRSSHTNYCPLDLAAALSAPPDFANAFASFPEYDPLLLSPPLRSPNRLPSLGTSAHGRGHSFLLPLPTSCIYLHSSTYQSHGAAFVYYLSPLPDCEILNNRERFLLILEFQVPSMVTGFP